MTAVLALYRSTIGKKVAMALSGLVYIGWVLFHMVGNLSFHFGATAVNDYAHKLQDMPPLVWTGRAVLLAALLVHVISAFSLMAQNRAARPSGYKGPKKTFATTAGAKSMRYGGIALLLFILWHILDLTIGVLAPVQGLGNVYQGAQFGFMRGEVYHNMLVSFGSPISLIVYVAAVVALSLHLFHGVWSVVQTLGFDEASTTGLWRSLAAFVAGVVLVGNLSFPLMGFALSVGGISPNDAITGHGQTYYGVDLPQGVTPTHPVSAH